MGRPRGPKPRNLTAKSKPLAKDRQYYERQPWETDKSWHGFVLYRDMGPERTVKKVAEVLAKNRQLTSKKFEALYQSVLDWSAWHGWRARVEAWEFEVDKERRKRILKAATDMRDRHGNIGKGLQQLGGIGLKTLLDQAAANGGTINLSVTDIKNLVDLGIRIERESNDEAGTIVEQRQILSADDKRESMKHLLDDDEALKAAKVLTKKLNAKS